MLTRIESPMIEMQRMIPTDWESYQKIAKLSKSIVALKKKSTGLESFKAKIKEGLR